MAHNYKELVTVVMTTYNNCDFTEACCRTFHRYYPDVRIILADGGSTDRTFADWRNFANDIVCIPDGKIEDCRNAAAAIVDTKYILTMDNDVKVIGEDALPLLMDVLEDYDDSAECGAYCVKIANWDKRIDYCSRVFDGVMECDWSPAYFTLHRTEAWKGVGGMPKEYYYEEPPFERTYKAKRYNNGGDGSISKYYQKNGWKIYTPCAEVPVLHFVGAAWWSTDMETSKWWLESYTHNAIRPLNDWEDYERGEKTL